jgi:hypothetical protein
VIKVIVVASAFALVAAPAQAQISPFGNSIPFLVNPYPVYGPGQPTEAGPGSNPGACAPTYAGRGGARYPCGEDAQPGQRR